MEHLSKILILGSTGLIGSACVRCFRNYGYKDLLLPTHVELDLSDRQAIVSYMQKHCPETVILAAAKVGGILCNKAYPADFIVTNLEIQLNTFHAAVKAGVKRFVFFGSSCMYPRECKQPMVEDMLLTGPLESTSMSYAMAKLAGLQMCQAFNEQYKKTQFMTIIPNSTYGPKDNFDLEKAHVLSALIRKMHEAKINALPKLTLWGSGNVCREFIYVDDVADAVLTVIKSDAINFPLNIGVGIDYSIKELADLIKGVVGYEGDIIWDVDKPEGVAQKLLDNSKILALGWNPKIDLESGIRKTYDWFLENFL